MVKLLLEKGATINAFDKKDRRAIHWAAYMGHVDVLRLLVSFGAELSCRDKQVRQSKLTINFDILASILASPNGGCTHTHT